LSEVIRWFSDWDASIIKPTFNSVYTFCKSVLRVVERTSVFVILVSEFFDEVDLVADGCGGVVCVDVVLNNVVTEGSSYVCYGGGNGGSEVS